MTAILVDANVLLDVMTEDARWLGWAAEAIERAADRYRLVINPIVYAEVSIDIRASRISMRRSRKLCSIVSPFRTKPPFSLARRSSPIGGEAGQRARRFRTSSLALTRLLLDIR